MDDLTMALATSIADGGPLYAGVILAAVLFVWKIWPTISDRMQREDEREDRKEQREADSQQHHIEHDREMARLQGQWLEQYSRATDVQKQSNELMESVKTNLDVLNATLTDSKLHSSEMGRKVDEIHAEVVPRRGEGTD